MSRPERWPSRFRSASIGSTMAVEDSASPAPSTVAAAQGAPNQCASRRQHRRRQHHLRGAQPEHRAPHHPEPLRPHLQADEEQQHHDAELGDAGDRVDVGDEPQPRRADQRAADQVAEHAAEAEAAREGDHQNGGREEDRQDEEHERPSRWSGAGQGRSCAAGPDRSIAFRPPILHGATYRAADQPRAGGLLRAVRRLQARGHASRSEVA